LSNRTKNHYRRNISRRRFVRFLALVLCFASVFVSSCFSSKNIDEIIYAVESRFPGVLQTPKNMQGGLSSIGSEEAISVGSTQDLFYATQEALYSFRSDLYLTVNSFEEFNQYWDELIEDGALHSAFQYPEVQIEYDNYEPCTVRVILDFNDTGIVMREILNSTNPIFTDPIQQELYDVAESIVESITDPEMSDKEIAIAVHDYLVVNTIYEDITNTVDQIDYLSTAHSILVRNEGQCQGYAEAYTLLMSIAGVESRIVSGSALDQRAKYQPHAWNQVKIDGIWYHVDVTWDDPIPDTGDQVISSYLLRSDEYFDRDHDWSDLFPYCPEDDVVGITDR